MDSIKAMGLANQIYCRNPLFLKQSDMARVMRPCTYVPQNERAWYMIPLMMASDSECCLALRVSTRSLMNSL